MSKIGERSSGLSTLKPQQAPAQACTTQVSARQMAAELGGLLSAVSAQKPVASPARSVAFSSSAPAGMAMGPEVLPTALGPLTDDRMSRCIAEAFQEVFQGDRLPNWQDRSRWMDVARTMRAENPKLSAEALRAAISDKLRQERDGLDSTSPASIDKFIQDAVSWVSQCYEDSPRSATGAELAKWRAFANEQLAKNPGMEPEKLKYAIQDAVRAQATGMTGPGGKPDIDRFIRDAVSWVSQCYEGQSRNATGAELAKWRKFANEQLAKDSNMEPEKLKYAIQDAVRAEVTGLTSEGGKPDIDRFIHEAVSWVSQCYVGQARGATGAELAKWRTFANEQLAKDPDMEPEKLKYAIQDAVRAELTGMTSAGGRPNIDKFIQDAVSWVSQCYEGQARNATGAELTKWRRFAEEQLAKDPDMEPEKLKYAIQDAVRAAATGTGGPASSANVDRFIEEAYSWVFQTYRGQPASNPRKPSPRELDAWRRFAQDELKKKPDMTAEDLKYLLTDSLRTALGNQ